MRLPDFLNFNSRCPICNNPLTLYMQWVNSIGWKAEMIEEGSWAFHPKMGLNKDKTIESGDYMLLTSKLGQIRTNFSTNKLRNEGKKFHMYFYYLCNPDGIKKTTWGDYKINIYKGCYYRASTLFEFQRDDDQESKNWSIQVVDNERKDIINKHETYSFKKKNNDVEKVYILDLDWEKVKTSLWFYTVTDAQAADKNFKAEDINDLHRELPLLKKRPKVGPGDREKLIDRLETWIIMS
jgi:hypothetical protein